MTPEGTASEIIQWLPADQRRPHHRGRHPRTHSALSAER